MKELTHYRRRLPHVRLTGATYFVTWRLAQEQPALEASERSLVQGALRHFDSHRYDLLAYVVMDDHVHVLFTPREKATVSQILHSWKSFTAKRLAAGARPAGSVWQDEYFDRVVRNDAELLEKARYILANPRKRWPDVKDYVWCWVMGSEDDSLDG